MMSDNNHASDETTYELITTGVTMVQCASQPGTIEMAMDRDYTHTERGDKIEVEYFTTQSNYKATTTVTGRIVDCYKHNITLVRDGDRKEMTVKRRLGHGKTDWHTMTVRTGNTTVGILEADAFDHGISFLRDDYEKVPVETDEDSEDTAPSGFEVGDEYVCGSDTVTITGTSDSGRGIEYTNNGRTTVRHWENLKEILDRKGYEQVATDGGTVTDADSEDADTDGYATVPKVVVNDPADIAEAIEPFKSLDCSATDRWAVTLADGTIYDSPETFRVAVDGSAGVRLGPYGTGSHTSFLVTDIARIEWYGPR